MRRALFPAFALMLSAACATAGAWPRDEGSGFASLSAEQDRDGNASRSFYAEYGRPGRHVWGVEVVRTTVGETSLLAWTQRSLDHGEGLNRFSYALGGGVILRDGERFPVGQLTLSWGRGFKRSGGGWLAADARIKVSGVSRTIRQRQGLDIVKQAYLTPEMVGKLDLTIGLKLGETYMVINQLRLERPQKGDAAAKLATSLVRDLYGPMKIELGLISSLSGPGENAVKLGTWVDF